MSNLIIEELREAEKYAIKKISKGGLEVADLSRDNVAIIEAMIQHDSAYINSTNVESEKSTAHCMIEFKKAVFSNNKTIDFNIILDAVVAVDRDNTTHLNSDGGGRKEISERIHQLSTDKLVKFLYDPIGTNYELIDIICKKTNSERKPQRNISFASKFCHYAAFYFFEGNPQQDNFSIYDKVLQINLPRYLKFYGIEADIKTVEKEKNRDGYVSYQKAVDAVIKASGSRISRNGFDHLVWYYYKGRKEMDLII